MSKLTLSDITKKDKELARATWVQVEKDDWGAGLALFKELLTSYPDYIRYFDQMKSSSGEDIFESPRFRKHITSALFPAIGEALQQLDNPEALVAHLGKIAVNHKRRKLERRHFETLQKVLVITLKKCVGSSFSKETEDAWNKILSVAFDNISTTIETS